MEKNERKVDMDMDLYDENAGLFLSFQLANQEYCVSVVKIKEIVEMPLITDAPETLDLLKGVMNFRGRAIPVIDLRIRFGLETAGCFDGANVMVVEIEGTSGLVTVGLAVDLILEVLTIESENVEQVPEFDTMTHSNYILGLTRTGENVKILMNPNKVLTFDELSVLESASKSNLYFLKNGRNSSRVQENR